MPARWIPITKGEADALEAPRRWESSEGTMIPMTREERA